MASWDADAVDKANKAKKASNKPTTPTSTRVPIDHTTPPIQENTEKKIKGSDTWAKPRRPSAEVSKHEFKEQTRRVVLANVPSDQVDLILDAVEKILPNLVRP